MHQAKAVGLIGLIAAASERALCQQRDAIISS